MTRNESRTVHCSLTPLVPKSGVAPDGIASAKPIRSESSTISWCSACRRRVIWRILGAGMVAIVVSTSSCVSRRAETYGSTLSVFMGRHQLETAADSHPHYATFAAVDENGSVDGLAEPISGLDQGQARYLVPILIDVV